MSRDGDDGIQAERPIERNCDQRAFDSRSQTKEATHPVAL